MPERKSKMFERHGLAIKRKVKNMKIKLISYSETPQVTGIEYDEMRDLREHPEKREHYNRLVHYRKVEDIKRRIRDRV